MNETNTENVKTTSNNISSSELDKETATKLRGDAIGDTLFSESFVLKTLLQFSNLDWNEEFEEDLCFLWDMTVEKDVCKYLFQVSFPSIACSAVAKYRGNNRFIEIVIGILANILCADCERTIEEQEILIIVNELDTFDSLILIQVLRFITAVVHMSQEIPFITAEILEKLNFILCNSSNNELLLKALETTEKITDDFKCSKEIINFEIIQSTFVAYETVLKSDENDFELDTSEKKLAVKYLLQVVINICAYIDKYDNKKLFCDITRHSEIFKNEFNKILGYFSLEENLFPINDNFVFYMSSFLYIVRIVDWNYASEIFIPVTKILLLLLECRDEANDVFKTTLELECFLISKVIGEIVYKDLKTFSRNDVNKLLKITKETDSEYDFQFSNQLEFLVDKFKYS